MKIAVYGVGNNFIRNYKWIANRYEIVLLVDGGKTKQRTTFQGFEVYSPEAILTSNYDAVLVTPNAHGDIVTILLSLGIDPEKFLFLGDILPSDDIGKELSIAFQIVGGLGDALIALNYIEAFRRKYDADHIKLYLETISRRNAYKALVPDQSIFTGICDISEEDVCPERYHLYIRIQRYPDILYADKQRIARLCPGLIDYIQLIEKFRIFHPRYFEKDFVADGISAAYESVCGRKRYEQPDVYGYLGLSEQYLFSLNTDTDALKIYGLNEANYITIHRGTEEKNYAESSVKLWTLDGYNAVFRFLNEAYPEFPVVLVGSEYEREDRIRFNGINLLGRTTLPELASIVGSARLHIDTEGGLVHLRHAVSAEPSIVLFGPTSSEFFGYEENENIRSSSCPYPCEWMREDWSRECIREDKRRICMENIRVESVQAAVERVLKR